MHGTPGNSGGNISGFGEGKADETQLEAVRIFVGVVLY
jgi:hypothetical protein